MTNLAKIPMGSDEFFRAFDELGVKLPLRKSSEEMSVVVDADGRDLLVVDVNADREDHQVRELAKWVALAINASCGVIATLPAPEAEPHG